MATLLFRHGLRPLRLAVRPLHQQQPHQPHTYPPPSQLHLSLHNQLQAHLQAHLQTWALQVRCQSTSTASSASVRGQAQDVAGQKTARSTQQQQQLQQQQQQKHQQCEAEPDADLNALSLTSAKTVQAQVVNASAAKSDVSLAPSSSKPSETAPETAQVQATPPITPSADVIRFPILQRLGPLTEMVKAYGRQQRKRPWTTQLWTALVIYFCADVLAQSIGGQQYDPARTGRNLIIGFCVAIPSYEWLIFLGNHFNYRSRLVSLAVKVFIAQFFFTPFFNTYFFSMQALLSGASWSDIVAHVKATVPTSCLNSCKVWPTVTAFSFAFLAPEYRNVFNGLVAIFWQAYLSFLNRSAQEDVEKAEAGLRDMTLRVANVDPLVINNGPTQADLVDKLTEELTEEDVETA
ncbi:Dihydroorotate dehydrogenase (quinone), mitochondrial [Ceratocystis pirilliformis]|uniref:Dihydroorotate dehydrogenase (Quinone), mitochondrial n=1 Tax=Ceratocystis pirilliformis TaxID=259994 RepID=A0ABR3ZLP5_9PEZI